MPPKRPDPHDLPLSFSPPLPLYLHDLLLADPSYQAALRYDVTPDAASFRQEETLKHLRTTQTIFSVTKLETFANCPFHHFCAYHLKLDEPREGITPLDKGRIVHQALFQFYRGLSKDRGTDLTAYDPETLRERMQAAVDAAFSERRYAEPRAFVVELERRTIARWMARFLEQEIQYEAESRTRPRLFELSFGQTREDEPADGHSMSRHLRLPSDDGRDILIDGKIDRVDLTPDGFAVLIDYKLGTKLPTLSDVQQGLRVQIPLYMQALKTLFNLVPIAGEYYSVRGLKRTGIYDRASLGDPLRKLHPRTSGPLSADELEQVIEETMDCIRAYVRRIQAGDISVAPHECPAYCPFNAVCRMEKEQRLEKRLDALADGT